MSNTTARDNRVSPLATHVGPKLAEAPAKQLVAEIIERLRATSPSWWTHEDLRATFPARDRFRWLEEESSLRGHLVHSLTGLAQGAALQLRSQLQADLVDAALDAGDTTLAVFEAAFEPLVLGAHGPEVKYWRTFRKQFPWDSKDKADQKVLAFVLEQLLVEVKLGSHQRRPILSHLELRRALDPRAWQHHLPEELRARVDAARLEAEAKGRPFGAAEELAIATPALLCQHLPHSEIKGVLDRAEEVLGIGKTGDTVAKKERPRLTELTGTAKPSPTPDELAFAFSDSDGPDLDLLETPEVN